jgi:hypothetical protein
MSVTSQHKVFVSAERRYRKGTQKNANCLVLEVRALGWQIVTDVYKKCSDILLRLRDPKQQGTTFLRNCLPIDTM